MIFLYLLEGTLVGRDCVAKLIELQIWEARSFPLNIDGL